MPFPLWGNQHPPLDTGPPGSPGPKGEDGHRAMTTFANAKLWIGVSHLFLMTLVTLMSQVLMVRTVSQVQKVNYLVTKLFHSKQSALWMTVVSILLHKHLWGNHVNHVKQVRLFKTIAVLICHTHCLNIHLLLFPSLYYISTHIRTYKGQKGVQGKKSISLTTHPHKTLKSVNGCFHLLHSAWNSIFFPFSFL